MKEPYFWSTDLDPQSRDAAPLTRFLATPFAWLFAAITARRIRRTVPTKIDAKVICIGNLTTGGVGKSPVVMMLRDYIAKTYNLRTASLSRGYGGHLKGPLRVDVDRHTAADIGDEPLMLAQSGEAWIGADRGAAGKAMSEDGINAIIMDDGHQNPSLYKDLSFIVVDAVSKFGNGFVIPKGPLREPIAVGLARADAVIIIGEGEEPPEVKASQLPILHAKIVPTHGLKTGPYVAFAGIGRPQKVFDTITELGCALADAIPFPDHHVYAKSDLKFLRQLASDHGAQLITTTKDYARLTPEQREGIETLSVMVQFESPALLDKLLEPLLKASHGEN
jgi:tetraacyldisaccharide 4'-kinase